MDQPLISANIRPNLFTRSGVSLGLRDKCKPRFEATIEGDHSDRFAEALGPELAAEVVEASRHPALVQKFLQKEHEGQVLSKIERCVLRNEIALDC